MIREARTNDKKTVFDLWNAVYPNQSVNYLTFYFKKLFNKGTCLVREQDNRIISSLQMNEHIIRFHGKMITVSYLLGMATLPDYRRRGHMRYLMNSMLDEVSHNHLFTLIDAFHPKLYAPFGFETVYMRKRYEIKEQELLHSSSLHTQKQATASQLLSAYRCFSSRFDGYYIRSKAYYENLLEELQLKEKHIIVYRDPIQGICGYLIYKIERDDIQVIEAIYLESSHLLRMLKAIAMNGKDFIIQVSEKERLEKIFPLAIPKKYGYMMVRVNDYELFNKYFQAKAKTPKEAFAIIKKPLWLHEYY